jgi:hypothetical protein
VVPPVCLKYVLAQRLCRAERLCAPFVIYIF